MRNLLLTILLLSTALFASAEGLEKLSPYVRRVAREHHRLMAKGKEQKARSIMVLVRTGDTDALEARGGRVYAAFRNNIVIASVPINNLKALAADARIERIEAGERCSISVDTTATLLNVPYVWGEKAVGDGPFSSLEGLNLRGKDVVVGVMDIGFDLTHPTFLSADGTRFRIKKFWDQLDYTADPDATGALPMGREFTTEESLLAKKHAADGLIDSHGTHTAGIAAGSGYRGMAESVGQKRYIGMAPDADLCLVANATTSDIGLIPEEMLPLYTTATDLLGFKYIFDYAESVGKPCVINFSEGGHQDFYDCQLYDELINEMVGSGRIISASAGNEGRKLSYLDKPSGVAKSHSLIYSNSPYALCFVRSDGKIRYSIDIDCEGTDPQHFTICSDEIINLPDSTRSDTLKIGSATYVISTVLYQSCYNNDELVAEVYVQDLTHSTFGGNSQRVGITLMDGAGEPSYHQEAYYYSGQFWSTAKTPGDAVATHNVHFPSSAGRIVSVGATIHRRGVTNYQGQWKQAELGEKGERGTYSSVGPTLAGLTKPDIMAPGTNIISSYSSYYLEANPQAGDIGWDVEHFQHNGRTYVWNSNSGTSMSAPVVTGIIALWLEALPTLTPEEIKDAFEHTAHRHDDPSLPYGETRTKDNYYGWGEIDAADGLRYLLEKYADGIKTVENGSGNGFSAGREQLFDLSGRALSAAPSSGIYIMKKANGAVVKRHF